MLEIMERNREKIEIDTMSPLIWAYVGDSVYEVYIRNKLVKLGIQKVNELQKEAVKYVSAKGQAKILSNMIDNNILTEKELDIVKRGRNNKRQNHPRHTDVITYKMSTGFEALIGYLYLNGELDRLEELLSYVEVV